MVGGDLEDLRYMSVAAAELSADKHGNLSMHTTAATSKDISEAEVVLEEIAIMEGRTLGGRIGRS